MAKKNKSRKIKSLLNQVHFPNAAGIDIGAEEFYVCIGKEKARLAGLEHSVTSFRTFNAGIRECIDWLKAYGIESVAMETTGNYWVALFDQLSEAGFKVYLVNAGHCKALPGRKTDVCDASWIQQLHTAGLLRNSYVLEIDQRAIRYLVRSRDTAIRDSAREVQHMQKAYTEMNVQLHHVLSDIDGWSGRKITKAIIDGERNPEVLADLRHPTCKTPREQVIEALDGNFRSEYVFALKQSFQKLEYIEGQIAELEMELDRLLCASLAPKEEEEEVEQQGGRNYTVKVNRLGQGKRTCGVDFRGYGVELFGVDLSAVPAISDGVLCDLIAELGNRESFLASFKSEKQFASWLGLCPDNRITGGKQQGRGKTRKVNNKLSRSLRIGAMSLKNNKSWLGDFSRKMKGRLGKPEGITATAHCLARIIFAMIKSGQAYDPKIGEESQKQSLERQIKAIQKKAQKLGMELVVATQAEPVTA